jgi:hypothetical protein
MIDGSRNVIRPNVGAKEQAEQTLESIDCGGSFSNSAAHLGA